MKIGSRLLGAYLLLLLLTTGPCNALTTGPMQAAAAAAAGPRFYINDCCISAALDALPNNQNGNEVSHAFMRLHGNQLSCALVH